MSLVAESNSLTSHAASPCQQGSHKTDFGRVWGEDVS